eukprot:jgi/Undpi1/11715/HiC_scaffold_37.g14010.m1
MSVFELHAVRRFALGIVSALVLAVAISAQGVELRRGAKPLTGSDANCSAPATITLKKVKAQTSEWKQIRRRGLRPGSSAYNLLYNKMMSRIREAAKAAAIDEGADLVVLKGDISDPKGLSVQDLTNEVIDNL